MPHSDLITVSELRHRTAHWSIEDLYADFGYDYADESAARSTEVERRRQRFMNMLAWKTRPTDPTLESEYVRRIFNQVNTSFAERWAFADPSRGPSETIAMSARFMLYRQGKRTGFRIGPHPMRFGSRDEEVDFLDPIRSEPTLYGVAPAHIEECVTDWCSSIQMMSPSCDGALAMSMIFIAIHPYSDANGRMARLLFAWLVRRWRLGEFWLDEHRDGEFQRTGNGLSSTKYLMTQFMLSIGGRANHYSWQDRRFRDERDELRLANSIREALGAIRSNSVRLCDLRGFSELRDHLRNDGHVTTSDPRFRTLLEFMHAARTLTGDARANDASSQHPEQYTVESS